MIYLMEEIFGKKAYWICCVILSAIFLIDASLIVVSLFSSLPIGESSDPFLMLLFYCLCPSFVFLSYVLTLLLIFREKITAKRSSNASYNIEATIIAFVVITGAGAFGSGVFSAATLYDSWRWFLFAAGLSQAFSYWVTICLIIIVVRVSNLGYRGKPVVSYGRKILEVLLQIALVPVSAFVNVLVFQIFIGGFFLAAIIVRNLFYKKFKGIKIDDYDDRMEGMGYSVIALPCRIISLVASVIALFVPHMYVSAIEPKTDRKYNQTAFKMTDIIVIERDDLKDPYDDMSEFDFDDDDDDEEEEILESTKTLD